MKKELRIGLYVVLVTLGFVIRLLCYLKVPHLGQFFQWKARPQKFDDRLDAVGVLHLIDVALQGNRQDFVLLKKKSIRFFTAIMLTVIICHLNIFISFKFAIKYFFLGNTTSGNNLRQLCVCPLQIQMPSLSPHWGQIIRRGYLSFVVHVIFMSCLKFKKSRRSSCKRLQLIRKHYTD